MSIIGHNAPISAVTRNQNLLRLSEQLFDLLVIGGGITGAAIAREAAYRGLRVALVEKKDFAWGASGRSTRLIHGGLRYLEQMHFKLVFEASRERRILMQIAPKLVRPLPILLPIFPNGPHSYIKVAAGLWLYDALALFKNVKRHRMLGPTEVRKAEPVLGKAMVAGAAQFFDGITDDSRLTLVTALSAHAEGAVIANHAEAIRFVEEKSQIAGAVVLDRIKGSQMTVRARLVVNAVGPFSDQIINSVLGLPHKRYLRLSKGVHANFLHDKLPLNHAVGMISPVDGRLMFAIPDKPFTFVGTTDTAYDGDPECVAADASDVAYILKSVNTFFQDCRLMEEDVVSTWAGLRPLIAVGTQGINEASREHAIWETLPGLMTIAGGKLTTHRVMARDFFRKAEPILRRSGVYPKKARDTATTQLPEKPEAPSDPLLGEKLAGTRYNWSDIDRSVREEMALTLCDVLIRRTHIFYEALDQGLSVAPAVARRIAPVLNWDNLEVRRQLDQYEAEVALNRLWRKG